LKDESNKGRKVLRRRLVALRALMNGLYALSGLLFVISYLYRNNQYYYLTDPYIGWAIICLFLGFFINVVYATR